MSAVLGTDVLGVPILPSDTVQIGSWGGMVRLVDVGLKGPIVRRKRTGNLLVDVGFGEQVTVHPGCVFVCRRDGLPGHEGNRGTRYDSHASVTP